MLLCRENMSKTPKTPKNFHACLICIYSVHRYIYICTHMCVCVCVQCVYMYKNSYVCNNINKISKYASIYKNYVYLCIYFCIC